MKLTSQYIERLIREELETPEREIPPSEYINFMRRDCSLLAQAINAISDFPMYGIVDERGDIHHVFVYDPQTKEAIDCRGRMPVERVFDKIRGGGNVHRKVSIEELEDIFGTYSDEEWEHAEEKARELI